MGAVWVRGARLRGWGHLSVHTDGFMTEV